MVPRPHFQKFRFPLPQIINAVYVHGCMCLCGRPCARVCLHTRVGQKSASGVVPQMLSILFYCCFLGGGVVYSSVFCFFEPSLPCRIRDPQPRSWVRAANVFNPQGLAPDPPLMGFPWTPNLRILAISWLRWTWPNAHCLQGTLITWRSLCLSLMYGANHRKTLGVQDHPS